MVSRKMVKGQTGGEDAVLLWVVLSSPLPFGWCSVPTLLPLRVRLYFFFDKGTGPTLHKMFSENTIFIFVVFLERTRKTVDVRKKKLFQTYC